MIRVASKASCPVTFATLVSSLTQSVWYHIEMINVPYTVPLTFPEYAMQRSTGGGKAKYRNDLQEGAHGNLSKSWWVARL